MCGRADRGTVAGSEVYQSQDLGLLHTAASVETGVYTFISSPSGAKASIASGCYTNHARALSTAH